MNKIYLIVFAAIFSIIIMSFDILSSNGKAGKTGSPGEADCTSCHAGTVNSGGGSVLITSPDLVGWAYTPGQTYQINVTVSQTSIPLFSFGFEALDASGANAGTLVITNSTETQIKTFTVSPNIRNNVVQKSNGGLTPNSHTFSFNWVAPNTNIGNVTFYVAGLACNNDGGTSGDFTYTSTQTVTFGTSVTDTKIENIKLSIYPNPVSENAILQYQLSENSDVNFELVSITGKVIFVNSNYEESVGLHEHKLLLDTLPKGIYFVNVYLNGVKYSEKLFVL